MEKCFTHASKISYSYIQVQAEKVNAAVRIRDKGAGRTEPGSEGRRQGHGRLHSLFLPAPAMYHSLT